MSFINIPSCTKRPIIPTHNIYLNPTSVCVAVKSEMIHFYINTFKKEWHRSLPEMKLHVLFNKCSEIVVSHTVQRDKLLAKLIKSRPPIRCLYMCTEGKAFNFDLIMLDRNQVLIQKMILLGWRVWWGL